MYLNVGVRIIFLHCPPALSSGMAGLWIRQLSSLDNTRCRIAGRPQWFFSHLFHSPTLSALQLSLLLSPLISLQPLREMSITCRQVSSSSSVMREVWLPAVMITLSMTSSVRSSLSGSLPTQGRFSVNSWLSSSPHFSFSSSTIVLMSSHSSLSSMSCQSYLYSANTNGAPMYPAPIVMADRTQNKSAKHSLKIIGAQCLASIAYWQRGTSVRQYSHWLTVWCA
jgi:hypothetical protein